MNILLIVTGSISAYKAVDLANSFRIREHNVKIILTDSAQKFITKLAFSGQRHEVYTTDDEWSYSKGVLHIDLAHWADTILLAPATLNTLAKYVNFLSDNLALSTLHAFKGLVYIAPSMNTTMYENSKELFDKLMTKNVHIIQPQVKLLACGDYGIGALADKQDIITSVLLPGKPIHLDFKGISNDSNSFTTINLLTELELPDSKHCGGFGFQRMHHKHEGIDLYCPNNSPVYACDSGTILNVQWLTGIECNSTWWNDTQYITIQHDNDSLITLYGELTPLPNIKAGTRVKKGEKIAHIKQVLKKDKGRPMAMLHFEQYQNSATKIPFSWNNNIGSVIGLENPFHYLKDAYSY
jgi:hypothetical protein